MTGTPIEPGRLFAGRYEVARLLGRGGMGAVYEVFDRRTDRRRALKVMLESVSASPGFRERFEREAKVAAGVKSEHLVEVLDAGFDAESGVPYLVMELLEGRDLAGVLAEDGCLDPATVGILLAQAARALDRLHAAGIVHRDLKPENLFVAARDDGSPCVKILDFGIAKLTTAAGPTADTGIGTPLYMAPEQLTGAARVDARTDVYALGQIAFSLLTGSAYFASELGAGHAMLPLLARLARGPEASASARAGVEALRLPPGFDAWFGRACHVDPDARFVSAGAAAAALEALAAALGSTAAAPVARWLGARSTGNGVDPGARTEVSGDAAAVSGEDATELAVLRAPSTPLPSSAPSSPARRPRRWLALGLGAIALAVVGAIALVGARRSSPAVASSTRTERPTSSETATGAARSGPNPLVDAGSKLACTPLRAHGVTEPAGWLGAAAAAIACRREQWMFAGGDRARVLPPGELFDLAGKQPEGYPEDPYGPADARGRALAAAKLRADAFFDGDVTATGKGFAVHLEIASRDGRALGAADGEAPELLDAVEQASEGLEAAAVLPRTEKPGAETVRATLVDSTGLGWALDRGVITQDFRRYCAALLARADFVGPLRTSAESACSQRGGTPAPLRRPLDRSSTAAFTESVLWHTGLQWDLPDRERVRSELQASFEHETHPEARLEHACAIQSLLLHKVSDSELLAYGAAIALAAPWEAAWTCAFLQMLPESYHSRADRALAGRVVAAWAPYDTETLRLRGIGSEEREALARGALRDHELHPTAVDPAAALGEEWLYLGRSREVRALAAELSTRGDEQRFVAGYLHMSAEANDGVPGRAFDEALRLIGGIELATGSRVELSFFWRALAIAAVLGRERDLADRWFDRLLAEPGRMKPDLISAAMGPLLLLCEALAPDRARRCVQLIDNAFARPPRTATYDALAKGALLAVAGDAKAAIAAWRPVVQETLWSPYLPIAVFEATGEDVLADAIDRAHRSWRLDHVVRDHFLGDLRDARRAARRGDKARARALATELLEAWSTLDVEVPWLAELRRLAAE